MSSRLPTIVPRARVHVDARPVDRGRRREQVHGGREVLVAEAEDGGAEDGGGEVRVSREGGVNERGGDLGDGDGVG